MDAASHLRSLEHFSPLGGVECLTAGHKLRHLTSRGESTLTISSTDILDASLLSNAAYNNSAGLLTYLDGSVWQPLGSDPVLSGPFHDQKLPRPADLPFLDPWDFYFGEGVGDSNFLFDNIFSQAFVARNSLDPNTVAISFRGMGLQDSLDVLAGGLTSFDAVYHRFEYLIESLEQYIAAKNITRVLVVGHSLGGAMAELFMRHHPDADGVQYVGVTFASPGDSSLSGVNDNRLLNFGHSEDPVFNAAQHWELGGNDVR